MLNFSCSSDESLEIKTIRDFDIYATDTLNNVFVFDMVPTTNGFLIASICGTSRISNKFGGDGRFYLLEVDNFGNVLWEDFCESRLVESGYPSNIISSGSDNYYLLWNEFNGSLKEVPFSVGNIPDSLDVQVLDCGGCRADKATQALDKIYTIGINEGVGGSTTYITELDLSLQSSRSLTEKSFDASRFGGFGLSDINFVNRINNFIHIESNELRLLFSGPAESDMILSHVGELIPEFADNNLWVAAMARNPDLKENFALLFQDSENPQGQSVFIPSVDLSGLPGESNLTTLLNEGTYTFSSLDPNFPQFLIYYNFERWVVVGTSLTGLPTIISINLNNKEIIRSELGDNSRLSVAKAELNSGDLYIAGTTIVNNRFQRPFLLKVAKEDIF
jgi:hypothetical protein